MVNFPAKQDLINSQQLLSSDKNRHNKIRILLVDDQNSIRQNLHVSLEAESGLEIIGEAVNGEAAIAQTKTLHPDVALIDVEMPVMNGLKATEIIKKRFANTKVIVLSSHDDNEYINKALKAGAKGYLLKNTPPTEIIHAIQYVNKGYLQLGPGLSEKLESSKIVLSSNNGATNSSQKHFTDIVSHKPINPAIDTILAQPNQSEWSSSTKELVETLPRVWTRGLLYFLTIFIGITIPWAMFSQVDETGNARGKLEPQGRVYTVEAPVMGTVSEVLVEENQFVETQQPLLILESKPAEAELEQARTKIEGQRNELGQSKILKNQLISTINTQKQQNESQLLEKQAQIAQTEQNIRHLQTTLSLAKETYDEAQQEVQRYLEAKNQGIISEIQVVEKQDLVREKKRLLEQARADLQQALLRLQEQEKNYQSSIHSGNIALLRNEEQLKEIETQIGTLVSQIKETQSQIDALNYQLEQRIIKAPANGFIFQLPAQKTGSVLEPGSLVAEIAPEQARLVVKAQMPSSESGFLELEMPVKLKFDAYPFQDYGVIEGKVIKISPTTKTVDTEAGTIEAYEVEIELEQNYILDRNKRINLKPGQKVTAEVIIRQRRLIDFVLDPFKKLQENGLEL